jgi:release factor glutamine methyltransferase
VTNIQQWREAAAGLDRLDCDVLLAHALGCNRADILAHPERTLNSATLGRLDSWRSRRLSGEPLAYILQIKEFWGLEFTVTPDVLIPRPDTETLVEHALTVIRSGDRVLELGTGSGAPIVSICVAHRERGNQARQSNPPLQATASDISAAALQLARNNAKRHGVAVSLLQSDWFAHIRGQFEVIISNPPYVASDDPHLSALTTEPRQALVAGRDGLDAIRHIVANAHKHLAPGGWLLLEHGYQQGQAVRELFHEAGYLNPRSEPDLSGHPRITKGHRSQ